jgi:amidase
VQSQAKGPLTEPAYLEARAKCWRMTREELIDAVMDEHRLDAMIAITTGPAGLIARGSTKDPIFGERGPGGGASGPAAIAGYPSITVPVGHVSNLPVGLLFFGRAWSELRLLALAAEFEAWTRARRVPRYLSTLRGE